MALQSGKGLDAGRALSQAAITIIHAERREQIQKRIAELSDDLHEALEELLADERLIPQGLSLQRIDSLSERLDGWAALFGVAARQAHDEVSRLYGLFADVRDNRLTTERFASALAETSAESVQEQPAQDDPNVIPSSIAERARYPLDQDDE